jgi:hypothetical protein
VWNDIQNDGVTQQRIYWNRYTVGVGWSGEQVIGSVPIGGIVSPPALAMNADGDGVIAWGELDAGDGVPLVRRFSGAGATLESEEPLAAVGALVTHIDAAIDAAGHAFVLYRRGPDVWVRRWDPMDDTWEAAVPLRSGDGGGGGSACSDDDQVGVAADGTALVTGCSPGLTLIYRVAYTPDSGDGTWATPAATLDASTPVDLATTVEANGDAWVLVQPNASNGTPTQMWRYRKTGPPAGWDATATPLPALKGNGNGVNGVGSRPRAWVGPGGHVFVANYYFEGFGSRVVVVRLE